MDEPGPRGAMQVWATRALAALSGSSLGLLVLGRTLQGVGLGLIPLAMAAARDALPPTKVTPAVALLSVAAAAGVGLGYPISGLIATHLGLDAAADRRGDHPRPTVQSHRAADVEERLVQ